MSFLFVFRVRLSCPWRKTEQKFRDQTKSNSSNFIPSYVITRLQQDQEFQNFVKYIRQTKVSFMMKVKVHWAKRKKSSLLKLWTAMYGRALLRSWIEPSTWNTPPPTVGKWKTSPRRFCWVWKKQSAKFAMLQQPASHQRKKKPALLSNSTLVC